MYTKVLGFLLFATFFMITWFIEWEYLWVIKSIHGVLCGMSFIVLIDYQRLLDNNVQKAVDNERLKCFHRYSKFNE